MNRVQPLATTALVAIQRFDHPAGLVHCDPREECAQAYSVNFLDRGGFSLQVGRRRWDLAGEHVFVTSPSLTYRCHHAERVPTDVCLSVMLAPGLVREFHETEARSPGHEGAVVPLTNHLAYLKLRLASFSERPVNAIAVEAAAVDLLPALTRGAAGRLYRPPQLAWYANRIDAVRDLLDVRFAEAHSLASLSRAVAVSPFHLARVFTQLVGVPPHRYLLRARMQQAASLLDEGASVTATCLAVGFGNLSHFIRVFRRTYGLTPAAFARTKRRERIDACDRSRSDR